MRCLRLGRKRGNFPGKRGSRALSWRTSMDPDVAMVADTFSFLALATRANAMDAHLRRWGLVLSIYKTEAMTTAPSNKGQLLWTQKKASLLQAV